MKVTIEVEQFDNGISLKWADIDGDTDQVAVVALDHEKEKTIGKMIWDDIANAMNAALTSKVKMEINYLVYFDDEQCKCDQKQRGLKNERETEKRK